MSGDTQNQKRTADLLELSTRSDPLSLLYLRHRRDIVEFVRRKFGSGPPEPEDVAQAVFLQLASQGDSDSIRNPRSFLLKSAQNLVLDYRRRVQRQRDSAEELKWQAQENLSDFDPERVVTGKERLKMLLRVLERLPVEKRQMILLARVQGLSCEEIGRRLGVSAEAVQKQIERVLKDCLSSLDIEERRLRNRAGGAHDSE